MLVYGNHGMLCMLIKNQSVDGKNKRDPSTNRRSNQSIYQPSNQRCHTFCSTDHDLQESSVSQPVVKVLPGTSAYDLQDLYVHMGPIDPITLSCVPAHHAHFTAHTRQHLGLEVQHKNRDVTALNKSTDCRLQMMKSTDCRPQVMR